MFTYSFMIDTIKIQLMIYTKEEFLMSFMSMTIYNIYSFFYLFLSIE